MNEEHPNTEQPTEAPPVATQRNESQPPTPQDSGRRLRELLAIPERERSDGVWDEIIALEIQLAPGNRASLPQADVGRRQEPGRRPVQGRRQDSSSGAKPAKRFFKKPRRGQNT